MAESTAWILQLGKRLTAAIGEREMIHLVDDPELFEVPESPHYCRQAIVWQGDVLPVVDIAAWLNSQVTDGENEQNIVGIVAYQEQAGELPQYGGLLLKSIPNRIQVSNRQACALPEPHDDWESLAISCFSNDGHATPILNLPLIFATTV